MKATPLNNNLKALRARVATLEDDLRFSEKLLIERTHEYSVASETVQTLAVNNTDLARRCDVLEVRVGQLLNTIEHIAIAAGALGIKTMK